MKMLVFLSLSFAALVSADNVRVEFKLQDYTNDGGLLASGKKCESSGHCDPRMTGYVDTEKPLNAWPGPKSDPTTWTTIFDGKSMDTAKINKIVSRDVCGGDFNKGNLRIKVVDVNKFTSNADITQFECLSGGLRDVARSEDAARWSEPKPCDGKSNPSKVRLTYSWRAFTLPSSACGSSNGNRSSGSGATSSTTKRSGLFGG